MCAWWVYAMENKNTRTRYQELVRARDQKREMVKITLKFFFYDSYSLFFICVGKFQVSPEKNHPT